MSNISLNESLGMLSFFDTSFSDNPSDVLYCSLNEIEPVFLEKELLTGKDFSLPKRIDPRNKLPIPQSIYDHTLRQMPNLFHSVNRSLLSKNEHSTCLAFLQSIKAKQEILPLQLMCFEETAERRQKEKIKFLQFLLHYNNSNYEKIYTSDRMFVELYQQFYKWQAKLLMDKHVDGIFQIHTGLPFPRSCGSAELSGEVTQVELVSSSGTPRHINLHEDFSKMRRNIETYFELYETGTPENVKSDKKFQFEISTEALVFLLCAGEYVDIPKEVLVKVLPDGDGDCAIEINDTFPSRNTGVHTTELVVTKCTEVFMRLRENKINEEINATGFSGAYSMEPIEKYMSKCRRMSQFDVSSNLVKWNLSLDDGVKQISILTQTKQGYKTEQKKSIVFPSLKLEYKPQFGCEIPSKATLIREWIEQRLSTSLQPTTDRHRINAGTFATILHEELSLDDIEQELQRYYNIKMPRLLGRLGDFLTLLTKVTPGRYLLRHNPRFQDKLILYAEVKEATSKTCVTLHGLLQKTPSDMAFMTTRQFTPIDDSLCSIVHDYYQVLPCSFPHWRNGQTRVIDDRNFILKKVEAKMNIKAAKEELSIKRRKKVKASKKHQKAKKKAQLKEEETKNTKEMHEDINNDRLLYGFEDAQVELDGPFVRS